MWTGKVPKDHIKIWGCEAFVDATAHDKLEPQSERLFSSATHKDPLVTSSTYLVKCGLCSRRGVFRERVQKPRRTVGRQIDLEEN